PMSMPDMAWAFADRASQRVAPANPAPINARRPGSDAVSVDVCAGACRGLFILFLSDERMGGAWG
ncbi:MAG: hypothetical protein LWW80_04105, partial [Thiomonas sp.]|nr:hypothetical protein [Thiomonas sp.]